jgi:hypothetical protein
MDFLHASCLQGSTDSCIEYGQRTNPAPAPTPSYDQQLRDIQTQELDGARNAALQALRAELKACHADFADLFNSCFKVCLLPQSVALEWHEKGSMSFGELAKALPRTCALKHPKQCEVALLLADEQLSDEAYSRRFTEIAASVDPVCREAKRDADDKRKAYEATYQSVQATTQHRIDQLDAELNAPPLPPPPIIIPPAAFPTYTHCTKFGSSLSCYNF